MTSTLHSLSVYEEIVAHNNLNMMTKLTDAVEPATQYWGGAKERSDAFRKAWIKATEETLIRKQEGKVPASKLYPPDLD